VILGFGAAVVIVLTIIIVLILYLVLQCRDRRKRLRAARAAMGGGGGASSGGGGSGGLLLAGCDRSSNSSFVERSTVDFIVPGEMELTTAVRSVSSKCNGNVNSGPQHAQELSNGNEKREQRTPDQPHFAYPPQPGCTSFPCGPPPRLPPPAFPVPNGYIGPEQWAATGFRPAMPPGYRAPPPPVSDVRSSPQRAHGQMSAGHCPCCGENNWHHMMPAAAMQLHVPATGSGGGFISLVPAGGHMKDCPHSAAPGAIFPASTVVLPDGREVLQIPAAALVPQAKKVVLGPQTSSVVSPRPFSAAGIAHPTEAIAFRPAWHHEGGPIANPLHAPPPHGGAAPFQPPSISIPPGMTVTAKTTQERVVLRRQSSLEGSFAAGALSDGEKERRAPRHSSVGGGRQHNHHHHQNQLLHRRRASASGVPGADAGLRTPHYATMSRAAQQLYLPWEQTTTVNASPFGPGGGVHSLSRRDKYALRYSSQPFLGSDDAGGVPTLNASILEYPSTSSQKASQQPPAAGNAAAAAVSVAAAQRDKSVGDSSKKAPTHMPSRPMKGPPPIASKAQLERLNYKSSAVINKVLKPALPEPTPRYVRPVSEQGSSIRNEEYLFPDLPPPPDALLEVPSSQRRQLLPDLMQNSRSSSVDDLQQLGVFSAAELAKRHAKGRLDYKDPYSTLPAQPSSSSNAGYRSSSSSSSAQGTAPGGGSHRTSSGGAVKIDLSRADKSIRRPGSAPDLASDPLSPRRRPPTAGAPSATGLASASSVRPRPGGLKHRSLERHASLDRSGRGRGGGTQTVAAKRVMFTGVSDIEDEEDTASDSQQVADDEDEDHVKPQPPALKKVPTPSSKHLVAALKPPKRMNPHHPQQRRGMVIRQTSTEASTDIWVLRQDNAPALQDEAAKHREKDIPVTGVIVAHPKPCPAFAPLPSMPRQPSSFQVPQQTMAPPPAQMRPMAPTGHPTPRLPRPLVPTVASGPTRPPTLPSAAPPQPTVSIASRPPPPPPPPRTTPVNGAAAASVGASSSSAGPRAPNPALQRPALSGQQVTESPDEGYHEDDGTGSEML